MLLCQLKRELFPIDSKKLISQRGILQWLLEILKENIINFMVRDIVNKFATPIVNRKIIMTNNLYSVAPWDTADYATSTKEAGKGQMATDDIKFTLGGEDPFKGEFVISWIGDPFFEKEEGAGCGFRMRRNLIIEIPHEQINDEFFGSLFDEDVMLPLKENDVIEATLSFQAYEDNGVGCQTIYVTNVKKLH